MNNLQKRLIKHLYQISHKQKQIVLDLVSKLNSGQPPKPGWELRILTDIDETEEWLKAVIDDEEIK